VNNRELQLLAFGSPPQPVAKCALELVLDVLQAEAHAIGEEHVESPRALALACRLEALAEFVAKYLAVEWEPTKEERAAADAEVAAARKLGLRAVPTAGDSSQ
jgi:hypothetical protein